MSHQSPSRRSEPDLGSLLHAAFRRLRHAWVDQLAPWDLTPFQWRALHTVIRSGAGIRPGNLAERLHIAARSATEVVDQLERKGLVTRSPDPVDRRALVVAPTDKALELHASVMAERRGLSEEHFSALSADEQADLARLLRRLAPEA